MQSERSTTQLYPHTSKKKLQNEYSTRCFVMVEFPYLFNYFIFKIRLWICEVILMGQNIFQFCYMTSTCECVIFIGLDPYWNEKSILICESVWGSKREQKRNMKDVNNVNRLLLVSLVYILSLSFGYWRILSVRYMFSFETSDNSEFRGIGVPCSLIPKKKKK